MTVEAVESVDRWRICWCGKPKEPNHVQCDAHKSARRAPGVLTVVRTPLPEVITLSAAERKADARRAMNRRKWWTRARVVDGLRRWYRDMGTTPTSTEEWHKLTRYTGVGPRRRYPSFFAILNYFPTFRAAWEGIGLVVDRSWEEWTPLEDWYLMEGMGILTRVEMAVDLNRTADAVHRHIYDLGQTTWERHGWSVNRLERATGVPAHRFRSYMAWGDLPYFKGTKVIYIDPGDLTVVKELDFDNLPPELEEDMLRSLRSRVVKILSGQDWRAGRLFSAQQKVTGRYSREGGRAHQQAPLKPVPRPNDISVGEYVRVVELVPERPNCLDRIGLVHMVYAANRKYSYSRTGGTGALWMARVEFKSQHNRSSGPRVTYSLPLTALARTDEPQEIGSSRWRTQTSTDHARSMSS